MSTLYRLTVTAEELAKVRDAIGHDGGAKPYRPRVAAAQSEPFNPNTGDPALDAFMTAHHNPKWRPAPLPKSPGLPALRPMKVYEQDEAERAWKFEARKAAEDIAAGKMPEAEAALREFIAIHRPVWGRRGGVYRSTEHGYTIEKTAMGLWRVLRPDGRELGEFRLWKQAEDAIAEHRGGSEKAA